MKEARYSYQNISSFSPQKRRRENANNEARLAKSESKSVFSQLTRSTSLMTWATYDSFLSGGEGNAKSTDCLQEEEETCSILQGRERSSTFCSNNVGSGVILEEEEQVDLDCENQQPLVEENHLERNEVPLKWITATTNLVKRMSFAGISSISSTAPPPSADTLQQPIGVSKKADTKENEHLRSRAQSYHYGSTLSSSDISTSSLEPQNSNDDLSQCSFFTSNQDDEMFERPPCIPPCSFVVKDVEALQMNYDDVLRKKTSLLDRNNWDKYDPHYNIEEVEVEDPTLLERIIMKGIQVKEKAKGVEDASDVPYFPVSECVWTFAGSLSILSLVTFLSTTIALWDDEGKDFAFPLGPFGALTTLQCSLTDAAPAQPRNVLCGSTLCGCIALLSTNIPEDIIPLWLRISLATSLSISSMARLGIMHPPGGAIALVFSMGGHDTIQLAFTLMCCSLAVLVSTVVNNLNETRQYPRYWNILAPFFQKRQY